jgi:hypothetical protein
MDLELLFIIFVAFFTSRTDHLLSLQKIFAQHGFCLDEL